MSLVKLKNEIVKACAAALATHLGRPGIVTGELKGHRITVRVGATGQPLYRPSCYSFDRFDGRVHTVFSVTLFAGDPAETAHGREILALAKATGNKVIADKGHTGSILAFFENRADDLHVTALKLEYERTGLQPKEQAKQTAPVAVEIAVPA